jgi:hypothetical protein
MTDDTLDENELRDLLARTARLPREIDPPDEAWKTIKAEIESPRVRAIAFWQRPAFLLAASLLLVASSSLITAVALRRPVSELPMASVASVQPQPAATASLAEFTRRENDYISAANRLSAMIESDQVQFSPETMAKLKESIRVIDAAILEARRALAADPANAQLIEMLSNSYSQKLDLLERTAEMGRS